ncbi:uncharacterized protein ACA1_184740 [Acanthamoeba castellanii str. Neff]|uniref:Transmembrane protein n=1 Tax=Acanthamoeba castellanii (strain ATCC 30010 / Neff) TaxID=1257118 RepID=L8H765_ACACF|nr:uncharacterized protein ACA1_184740 [Acanthamoeba castellanii str. Neff]ELR20321.1 hypothetical protein ACA1_184740 [Acanthamoeba castellanii str. Neff]
MDDKLTVGTASSTSEPTPPSVASAGNIEAQNGDVRRGGRVLAINPNCWSCFSFFGLALLVGLVGAATLVDIVWGFIDHDECLSNTIFGLDNGIVYTVSSCVLLACDLVLWLVIPNWDALKSIAKTLVCTLPAYLLAANYVFYGYQLFSNFPEHPAARAMWIFAYLASLAANLAALVFCIAFNFVMKVEISDIHRLFFVGAIAVQMAGKVFLCAVLEVNLIHCLNVTTTNLGLRLAAQMSILCYLFFAILLGVNICRHIISSDEDLDYFSPTHRKADQKAVWIKIQDKKPFFC